MGSRPGCRDAQGASCDWFVVTYVATALCCVLGAGDTFVLRLPFVFFSPDIAPWQPYISAAALVGGSLGFGAAIFWHRRARAWLSFVLLAGSLVAQFGPFAYWAAFDGRLPYRLTLMVAPCVSSAVLALVVVMLWLAVVQPALGCGLLPELIHPGWLLAMACILVPCVAASAWIGWLLHGVLLGAALLWLAVATPSALSRLGQHQTHQNLTWALCSCALIAVGLGAWRAFGWLPPALVRTTNHSIIYYQRGPVHDLRVTSGQEALHVFVDGHLRLSTLDQRRWAHALARPALSRLACPKRALVLSVGEGLIERELLGDACIESITSVVRDRVILDTARRQPWWRRMTAESWSSPRVQAVERDPAAWLLQPSTETFDVAIVDLPDPDDFVNAKYYTRFFYRSLRKRMSEHALLVVQATSARRSPQTFASIRATVEAAALYTLPYRVALTTLGEWSFILASVREMPPVMRGSFLARTALLARETFIFPPDTRPTQLPKNLVSTLDEPVTMDLFTDEQNGESF
jgi:predicted membrane-bound spermidine synthase